MSRGQTPAGQAQDDRPSSLSNRSAMPGPQGLPTHLLAQLNDSSHNPLHSQDTASNITGNSSSAEQVVTSFLNSYFSVEWTTPGRTSEDYSKLKEEFYQSYNPQIGVHTAAVLGGILGWLIVYLVYKTKVKKWVLRLSRRKCPNKQPKHKKEDSFSVFADFKENEMNRCNLPCLHMGNHVQNMLQQRLWNSDHIGQHTEFPSYLEDCSFHRRDCPFDHSLEMCLAEQDMYCQPEHHDSLYTAQESLANNQHHIMPSIVVEAFPSVTSAVSVPNTVLHNFKCPEQQGGEKNDQQAKRMTKESGDWEKRKTEEVGKERKKKRYRRRKRQSQDRRCPEVRVVDEEESDTKCLLPPIGSPSDSARATARWIQNMPLLMRSYQDINGLVLKVQPSTMGFRKQSSCPLISTALRYAALPLLGLPHMGCNNSMPHLPENGLGIAKSNGDVLFPLNQRNIGPDDKDVNSLLAAPWCSIPRSQSSLSHLETRRPRVLLTPPATSTGCLTLPQPPVTVVQSQTSSPVADTVKPVPGMLKLICPATSSPVPIPVTPTVTIQNSTSRVGRGLVPDGHPRHVVDSDSSSSCFDPLTHLHLECLCRPENEPWQQQQLRQQQQHRHKRQQKHKQQYQNHHQHQRRQQAFPHNSHVDVTLRSSRTFFDDYEDNGDSCSGSGGRGCGGGAGAGDDSSDGESRCSRQDSSPSGIFCVSSLPLRDQGSVGNEHPLVSHDAVSTLETRL